jgi:hypothetical protein
MDTARRKAQLAAYRERKVAAGIYAVRCTASGETWVGRAPDLDTIWRRLSFELVQRACRRPLLQAAWDAHGADAFSFEPLERIDEDVAYVRDKKLAARLDYWRAELAAQSV